MRLRSLLLAVLLLAGCRSSDTVRQTSGPVLAPLQAVSEQMAPAPPAPRDVSDAITGIARGFDGDVGIAVMDVQNGWIADYQGNRSFPQQSVAKLWVAMTVLDQVDRGALRLDTPVFMGPADLSVFSQPIAPLVQPAGYFTNVGDLMRRALVQSDNAADDMLIRLAGGVPVVERTLAQRGIGGVAVGADQMHLQSQIAGVVWQARFAGQAPEFSAARARVPAEVREARLEQYLQAPPDGATPEATVRALSRLARGRLLSPASTAVMLADMHAARTGRSRLRGGLEPGWTIAHKTGTGPDWRGESVGINDVGLITAPDGHVYAVAVYIAHTGQPTPVRLAMMQAVSQTIVRHWTATRPGHQAPAAQAGPAATTERDKSPNADDRGSESPE